MQKKFIISATHGEIEKLIKAQYGYEYSIPADEEVSNGVSLEYRVTNKALDAYDAQRLEEYKKTGKGQYLLSTLLNDLCIAGKLETGDYVIEVFW